MDRVVGISNGANAAIHALAIAARDGGSVQAGNAAAELGVSASYLSKILRKLASGGLLASTRGIGGGFALTRPAASLSCMEVLTTLEGAIPRRECLFPEAVCSTRKCALSALCIEAEARLRSVLESTNIEELSRCFRKPADC